MKINLPLTLVLLSVIHICTGQNETVNGNLTINGGTGGTSNKLIFKTSDNGDLSKFIATESYWTVIGANGNEGWKFKDDSGDVLMQINGLGNNDGNVGIGTTAPTAKLHVNGIFRAQDKILVNRAGSYRIALNGENDSYIKGRNATSETKFEINTNGVTYFNGGDVGIGTTAPTAKLHVNGILRAQDKILVNKDGSYRLALNGENDSYFLGRNAASETKFDIRTNGNTYFNGGNVGIGTSTPAALFEVNDNINNDWLSKMYNGGGDGFGLLIQSGYGGAQSANVGTILQLEDGNGNLRMKVQSNGKVGIGTNDIPNGYKLAIAGSAIAEEIDVQLQGQWPDFVFKEAYELPSLKEVETHIRRKGHLQNIPSEEEVKEKGINLGEMDAKLLQKIEELMLYTIQQQKEIEDLKKEIQDLKG
ncbi:hypothetical protein [Maribacter sp. 2307UL18-2]|uniref:hypothetical protein n=1 Tax=Maribacter sp. 2307UL18-2 TaxID=3386274 RepID=UPI0039BC8560